MDLLIAANTVAQEQADKAPASGVSGWATDGNPATGQLATDAPAWHYNMMMSELLAIIQAAGITPSNSDWSQVLKAMQTIFSPAQYAVAPYSAKLAQLVGGYPIGAVVFDAAGNYWRSTQDSNLSVPGDDGAKWVNFFAGILTKQQADLLYLSLLGGNVTGPMDWGSKTVASTVTHRFWSSGPPAAGDAAPDATLTIAGGTPGTANKGSAALAVAELDLSNVASTLLPDAEKLQNPVTLSQLRQYCPVGVPQPWPTATPPTGWLLCNGAAFDGTLYPGLAQAYPSLLLPDLRGEFIRGWDNGRGVDSGRALLSDQGDAIRNITGTLVSGNDGSTSATGVFKSGSTINSWLQYGNDYPDLMHTTFDTSLVVPTAAENRPRNIAFNYIVRAA